MKKITFNQNWERTTGGGIGFFGGAGGGMRVDLPDDYVINTERGPDATGGAASGVRADDVRAEATLTVTAPGLEGARVTIQCG